MPVENAHARGVAPQLIEEIVDRAERIVRRRHERATDRVHDEDIFDHDKAATRIARREVDGPDREWKELDVVEELALIPDVVAVRDDIRAVGVELARDVQRESRPTGGVLAIHDREIDLVLDSDLRQQRLDRISPWATHDVADKKNPHGLGMRRARTRTTRCRSAGEPGRKP